MIEDEFETIIYKLAIPNKEVQISLNKLFVQYLTDEISDQKRRDLYTSLKDVNLEEFKNTLISLFASILYNNYVKNNISDYEGYYASVIYAYLASLGLELIAEDVTNKSRIDLTIKFKDKIYIIEFKVIEDKGLKIKGVSNSALNQIKEKKYYQKYLHSKTYNLNPQIYLIRIEFDKDEKNICGFWWRKVNVL